MKKIWFGLLILVGCSSNPYREYEKFPVGGNKSDLVEQVGSPYKSKFKNGVDIWTYRFFDNDQTIYRDVQLKNNKVISKGENQEAREAEIEDKVSEGLKKSPVDYDKVPPKEKHDDKKKNPIPNY